MTTEHQYPDGCTIRAAVESDLLQLLQVYARSDEGRNPRPSAPTIEEETTWGRMMATNDLTVYVAEIDDRLVGTATFLVLPNLVYECAPTGFIEAMVVSTSQRRRGVASRLLTHVLDDARSLGCNKIQLLAHKDHATDGAHDLYRSVGFTAEAEGFRHYLIKGR